jgi:hypothetical protein
MKLKGGGGLRIGRRWKRTTGVCMIWDDLEQGRECVSMCSKNGWLHFRIGNLLVQILNDYGPGRSLSS